MRQKRVVRDSFSMVLLRAAWAAPVMESASSRMMILKGGHFFPLEDQELRNVIDKLAQFVARNGPEFEKMTMEKQKDNLKFSFLGVQGVSQRLLMSSRLALTQGGGVSHHATINATNPTTQPQGGL
ncbi:hypothetical protein CRUP_003883 [Coryphaenoides rupestris]|nr:hypothetical protein CRUP_003883 [Coryphaenoides rupestris]